VLDRIAVPPGVRGFSGTKSASKRIIFSEILE
jgi:hypothetical protein